MLMLLRWWWSGWEARLVSLTLLALLASILAEKLAAPVILIMLLNLISYAAGGFFGAQAAVEQLRHRHIDVDLLMLLAAIGAASIGEWHEGATLLFLFSLSHVLQEYALNRSRAAIRNLYQLYPEECTVRRDGQPQNMQIHDVVIGDVVLIRPGERIPVDGRVLAGASAINEATLTGESLPVDKVPGDRVFAGTLNTQGALEIVAEQLASDSTLARIIQHVEEAQESKAPTQRLIDRFGSRYSTLVLLAIAALIVLPPTLLGVEFRANFYRAMVLLTVACPCALVISTPAAYLSAIATAARSGLLFKGGAFLEAMAGLRAVAFDKTGTLTRGQPKVTDIQPAAGTDIDELLRLAARIEARSEHPLARAILRAADERELLRDDGEEVVEFLSEPGLGVRAQLGEHTFRLGRVPYLAEDQPLPPELTDAWHALGAAGKSVVGILRAGAPHRWLGLIAFADQLREDAIPVLRELRARGLHIAMFTGDSEVVARNIAAPLGIEDVHAALLPADKVQRLRQLEAQYGASAMIGEGVNDAPALASAPVGVALGGAGSDIALESADIVLMGNRLSLLLDALDISHRARRVVMQNVVFSLAGMALLVAGVFLFELPLPLGVLGHEGSTLIVVLNGLISLLLLPEIRRQRGAKR